jgi:HEAT repeat protein
VKGAIAHLGPKGLRALLTASLREDLDARAREHLAWMISHFREPEVQSLVEQLRRGEWNREAIRAVLEETQHREAEHPGVRDFGEQEEQELEVMLEALAGGDKIDRWRAVEALSRRGDARAVAALQTLENDPDEPIRLAAAQALERLGRRKGGAA